jgi:hypothetical protein
VGDDGKEGRGGGGIYFSLQNDSLLLDLHTDGFPERLYTKVSRLFREVRYPIDNMNSSRVICTAGYDTEAK